MRHIELERKLLNQKADVAENKDLAEQSKDKVLPELLKSLAGQATVDFQRSRSMSAMD
jgi:hypothetical protein